MAEPSLFNDIRDLLEGVVSFIENDAPDELDGGQAGYILGSLHEQARGLLPRIDRAREILDKHLKAAYRQGFQEGGEAKEWVNDILTELAKPDPDEHQYARNDDGSYMTPEQSDEGWAVQ